MITGYKCFDLAQMFLIICLLSLLVDNRITGQDGQGFLVIGRIQRRCEHMLVPSSTSNRSPV